MKFYIKNAIVTILLALVVQMTCGQSTVPGSTASQNYVATFTPHNSGITTNAALTTNAADKAIVEISIQYFDGLGRPLQAVQRQGSPLGYDIIQPFAYDAFGREEKKYLPYTPQTGVTGNYRTDALTTGQTTFYTTPPSGSGVSAVPNPYSVTVFEPSPLNRGTEQGAPGAAWQPLDATITTSGHTGKIVYTNNNLIPWTGTGADTANSTLVAFYAISTIDLTTQQRTLAKTGNYNAGELYLTISKDENWKNGRGGTTEEYKDKKGHVILKRSYNYSGGVLQRSSTYYVYDNLGNLAFVLPQLSNADNTLPAQAILDNLCYQYRYDERNRLTQKKIPGKDWEYSVYNKLDQPVLTQDALQRGVNQWKVAKYDALGRLIMTGLYNAPSAIPLSTLQASIYAGAQWDVRNTADITTGYTLTSYPALSKTLTINYYDDYVGIPGVPAVFSAIPAGAIASPKGLLTATKTAVLNSITNASPDYLWSASYYDDKGRNIKSNKQHYLGGSVSIYNYDEINNVYNFTDQVTAFTRKHYTKNAAGTAAVLSVTIANNYDYDHMGRKINSWEQITNGALASDTKVLLAKNEYNEIGQLWKKHLHSTDNGTSFKQDITYSYNERGWLLTNSAPLFAMQLYYNTGTNKQYNGNIAYQYWGIPGNLNKNNGYSYDQLNRLISSTSSVGNKEDNINYDLMGNITSLNRYATNTLIDQLTYTYATGTNQLQSVTDATANNAGQKSGTANYGYDANGNLTADNSKGITNIKYNLLNQPETITGKGTAYTYDAAGQKLSRLISTSQTDYISGIQYDGTTAASAITFIKTEEGRAIPNGTTAYNYEYNLTDHLDNSRVSFDTGTGTARLVQTDDYYPFGMDIVIGTRVSPTNNYLYNKKELQENLGLYDYGARFYDPAIARWTSPDPMAEKYSNWSPYTYCKDNPISFFDFEGGDVTPAQYKAFFLNYAVSLYEQAKSRGASTTGALTLVSQIALESGYATNSGALKHKNPYSLMPNGKMADFPDYSTATAAFFGNLDKHWPSAMATLQGESISADDIDKAYHTGDYESLGSAYMVRDKVNDYDYGAKILGANNSISRRFIKALDQGIADNNAIISKDSKIISGDLSQIQDMISKGDLDGAAKISEHLNKTTKESNSAQNDNDRYNEIKKDLERRHQ